jgi:hypothetical protein
MDLFPSSSEEMERFSVLGRLERANINPLILGSKYLFADIDSHISRLD